MLKSEDFAKILKDQHITPPDMGAAIVVALIDQRIVLERIAERLDRIAWAIEDRNAELKKPGRE